MDWLSPYQMEQLKYIEQWYCIVVMERMLSQKVKLSIYRSIFVPLTYGHEHVVMTK